MCVCERVCVCVCAGECAGARVWGAATRRRGAIARACTGPTLALPGAAAAQRGLGGPRPTAGLLLHTAVRGQEATADGLTGLASRLPKLPLW